MTQTAMNFASRPDLTVPACRYHLSHANQPSAESRYCYLGTAFRFPDELLSPQNSIKLAWNGSATATPWKPKPALSSSP